MWLRSTERVITSFSPTGKRSWGDASLSSPPLETQFDGCQYAVTLRLLTLRRMIQAISRPRKFHLRFEKPSVPCL